MRGGKIRKYCLVKWEKPNNGFYKFNVDGTATDKPGPTGIGGVIHDDLGRQNLVFTESAGVLDTNGAELLAIRKAILIWLLCGNDNLVMEGDSVNALAWASGRKKPPWKMINVVRQIRSLSRQGLSSSSTRGNWPVVLPTFWPRLGSIKWS